MIMILSQYFHNLPYLIAYWLIMFFYSSNNEIYIIFVSNWVLIFFSDSQEQRIIE